MDIKGGGYDAVILLGGNIGNVRESFEQAKSRLEVLGKIENESSLYQTEAWGMENSAPFLNQVLILKTDLRAKELLLEVLEIEKLMGRERNNGEIYVSRNIDIDILFFDSLILKDEILEIPHPRLHLRKFTLAPLREILPNFVHPKLNKSITELHEEVKDGLTVEKIDE